MSISIQLVEIPENEQVGSRQISLPDAGGSIGRSYDCNIQLPDFQRQLSRVHAEIRRDDKGQYYVIDRSTNGLLVNNRRLGQGQRQAINDGDLLKMGSYVLLISDMQSLFAESADPWDEPAPAEKPVFSMDEMKKEDTQWGRLSSTDPFDDGDLSAGPLSANSMSADTGFSHDKVMSDDSTGYDPFDDGFDMPMAEPTMSARPSASQSQSQSQYQSSSFTRNNASEALHPVTLEASAGDNGTDQQLIRDSLAQLNQLIDQQRQLQAESYSHDRLMDCIERALSRFLEELDPAGQEEMFQDYISGWGNKDKKFWRLYRKQFSQKLQRKEYHRQFAALFVEELRGKGQ